jgi:sulfite reductase (NADPH) flavoprotein alpha-component
MIAEDKLQQLHHFVNTFSKEELIWVNGYLSGLLNSGTIPKQLADKKSSQSVSRITIAYGTETGNAKRVASDFAIAAKRNGVVAKLVGLDQYRATELSKEEYFFVIISTQGDGEPPSAAQKFFDFIHSERIILENLKFGVLGLGDTSYPLFCKAGEDVDEQLGRLGAERVIDLKRCDVDYQEDAKDWFNLVLTTLGQQAIQVQDVSAPTKKAAENRSFRGRILSHVNLNDNPSEKETYHIEIGLDEQPVYQPGDAVGIYPSNKAELVEKIIRLVGIDPAKEVVTAKVAASVRELLTKHLSISYLQNSVVQKYAAVVGSPIPETRIDLLDLLRIYPVKDETEFEQIVKILTPIVPRLYSIASSPTAHYKEIHLTVAKNKYSVNNETKVGLCSDFLSGLSEGTSVDFYIHKNKNFKLPAPEKDIVMIGPGTGIAPFRSFIAERDATGATGRNWLFFGDRNFTTDFLYQTEWQQFANAGVLAKINLAWSRDGAQKHYVQHELLKEGKELMNWLEAGAHIYLCGAKQPMSSDVENSLLQIIETEKAISKEAAVAFLEELSNEGRYSKDVY